MGRMWVVGLLPFLPWSPPPHPPPPHQLWPRPPPYPTPRSRVAFAVRYAPWWLDTSVVMPGSAARARLVEPRHVPPVKRLHVRDAVDHDDVGAHTLRLDAVPHRHVALSKGGRHIPPIDPVRPGADHVGVLAWAF